MPDATVTGGKKNKKNKRRISLLFSFAGKILGQQVNDT